MGSRANQSATIMEQNRCQPPGSTCIKIIRILRILQQILFPYTVTRDMYFQLAVIVAKEYRTSEDR
eukprot:1213072-Amorphochlora_amoeboformis.AAC.1